MNRNSIATATAIASGAVLAASALAGSPASAGETGSHAPEAKTRTFAVVAGSLESLKGNRHQLLLTTSDGTVDSSSLLRSYYCPSGATITPTWVSSRCTHRRTLKLSNAGQDGGGIGKISSTGKSATQFGLIRAKSINGATVETFGTGISILRHDVDEFAVRGDFGGRNFLREHRYGNFEYIG